MKTLHEVHTCILAFWHKMCPKRTLGMTISSGTQSMNRCKVSENVLKAINYNIKGISNRDFYSGPRKQRPLKYFFKRTLQVLKQANIDTCI